MSTAASTGFFGHPKGLQTLFFTEMWERFSYYGMRAMLMLYMTDQVTGGMGIDATTAGAIYGLYTFGVYVLALPGGWIADHLYGQWRSVLYGGILIALGHYCLAIPMNGTFFAGLFLIVLGTGMLKPNVSAIVGDLYPEKNAFRDAGFSIFYSGINIGALLGPILCGLFRVNLGWHWGFGLAGLGMTAALVQYVLGGKHLQGCGELRPEMAEPQVLSKSRRLALGGLGLAIPMCGLFAWLVQSGTLSLVRFAQLTGLIVVIIAAIYFAITIIFVCRDRIERGRVAACFFLFIGAAMFWSGFEQAGTSMTLFTEELTNRNLMGWTVPTELLQSVNPLFIIILAPVFGVIWVKLADRAPSTGIKFALGLVMLGVGFFVLAWGSTYATGPSSVGMHWLVVTYFFHTVGELCLSPVGLSNMTKLAPDRLVGQMMGVWFMGSALGNLIAGLVAGFTESMSPERLFSAVAFIAVGGGIFFLMLTPVIKKLMHGIK